jgi:hypothetical protein
MKHNILRYGLMKRLGPGIRLSCFLTFKCTLDCFYCTLRAGGGYPESTTMSAVEWRMKIKRFPVKIREVVLSGGEPMLYPHFVEFAQFLLDSGYYVTIYSNLSLKKGLSLQPSRKLRFDASKHGQVRGEVPFYYEEYAKKYRVDCNDIKKEKTPIQRNFKIEMGEVTKKGMLRCYECKGRNYYPDHGVCYCDRIAIAPDGLMFQNQMDLIRHYTRVDDGPR